MNRSEKQRGISRLAGDTTTTVWSLIATMPTVQSLRAVSLRDAPAGVTPPVVRTGPHIRFIYLGDTSSPLSVKNYHGLLVTAELLLGRALLARAQGLLPVHLGVGARHHRKVFMRPPRSAFTSPTPEYRRWYTSDGLARSRPLPLEDLALEIHRLDQQPMPAARRLAALQSWGLSQEEQDWLIARSEVDISRRPLHRGELDALALTLERIVSTCGMPVTLEPYLSANRRIATRAAAVLGSMVDTYMPAPFALDSLANAFAAAHAAHLSRLAFAPAPSPASKSAGHWFLAKRQRLRALLSRRGGQAQAGGRLTSGGG